MFSRPFVEYQFYHKLKLETSLKYNPQMARMRGEFPANFEVILINFFCVMIRKSKKPFFFWSTTPNQAQPVKGLRKK